VDRGVESLGCLCPSRTSERLFIIGDLDTVTNSLGLLITRDLFSLSSWIHDREASVVSGKLLREDSSFVQVDLPHRLLVIKVFEERRS